MRRNLTAAIAMVALLLPACALKQQPVDDLALTVGELVLQIDNAERTAFEGGVISAERHKQNGPIVLKLLYAARAFERAVAAGEDGRARRQELAAVLADLQKTAGDVPDLAAAIGVLQRFLAE